MKLPIIFAIFIASSAWIIRPVNAISGKTSLINELIGNEDRPVRLTVFSCAKQAEKVEFLQYITVPADFQSFVQQLNLTQIDELHQTWFMVSMDCQESWSFLRQVRFCLFD